MISECVDIWEGTFLKLKEHENLTSIKFRLPIFLIAYGDISSESVFI